VDLEQIKKEKEECEFRIKSILNTFSERTGLRVLSIGIRPKEEGGHIIITKIHIKAELPF
jgi:hypothetical protein